MNPVRIAVMIASLALTGCAPRIQVSADGTQLDIVSKATMPSGVSSKVLFVTNLNPDCALIDIPVVRLVQPPAHGNLEIVQAEDFPTYQGNNPRTICNTMRVKGVRVAYKSSAGYVGGDEFAYEVFVAGHVVRRHVGVNVL
jgi:hypothetical protein